MQISQILKERRFLSAFTTQFLGAFNDNFFKNALVILIAYRSVTVFGITPEKIIVIAGGIFILPFFLFSALAGKIADEVDKAQLMRWVKLFEVFIMLIAWMGFVTHAFGLLLFTLFLMGVHSSIFGPVKYSYLPRVMLTEGELLAANSLFQMGTFLAILLGTILGGVAVSYQPSGEFIAGLGGVIIAILGLVASLFVPSVKPLNSKRSSFTWNFWDPIFEVFRELRKDRTLFLSVIGVSWFWFFGAALLSILPTLGSKVLGASEGVTTSFLAVFSLGIGFGSILCKRLSGDRIELGLVPIGSIGLSLFSADLYFATLAIGPANAELSNFWSFLARSGAWRVLLDLLGLAVAGGLFIVPIMTLIQSRSNPGKVSRVIAGNNVMNSAAMVGAAIVLLVLLGSGISIAQIFLVLAVLNLIVAAYVYLLMPEFTLRFLAWILSRTIYQVKIHGLDNLPKSGSCFVAANHVSYVDWLFLFAASRRPIRFVMDHTFLKIPLLGWLFRHAKVIPIAQSKENPKLLDEAFAKISQELQLGNIVCIFPEGRLTRDGKLGVFRGGVQRALARDPVPVVPVALHGLWTSIFSRNPDVDRLRLWRSWRRPVTLTFGEPLLPEQASTEAIEAAVTKLLKLAESETESGVSKASRKE